MAGPSTRRVLWLIDQHNCNEDGSRSSNKGIQVLLLNYCHDASLISPLRANLYLHYCVDKWLELKYPSVKMVRYADDLIIHCCSFTIATEVRSAL